MLSTDPIDIPLDPLTGEMAFTDGALVLTTGVAAVAQGIDIALACIKGEWFADLEDGVPWFASPTVTEEEALLGAKFDELKMSAAIREAILSVPGVGEILSLRVTFESSTRAVSVAWEVRTSFGDSIADTFAIGST